MSYVPHKLQIDRSQIVIGILVITKGRLEQCYFKKERNRSHPKFAGHIFSHHCGP